MTAKMIVRTTPQNRKDLAKLFTGVGAEIGVERAIYSKQIAKTASQLYRIDSWKAGVGFGDHITQDKIDAFYEEAKERMRPFGCKFIRKLSMDAVKDFEDESLDFVYIDAHHRYECVKEDIREWSKKVKKGGIVSGHDYIDKRASGYKGYVFGVIRAVNELDAEITIWQGDKSPSWSYIK